MANQLATHTTAPPSAWISRVFEVMHATYGDSFTRKWSDIKPEVMSELWSKGLAGFSAQEITRGISHLPKSFPPDVQEFKLLCRPTLNDEVAYHEAIYQLGKRATGQDKWSDPAIFWAAVEFGQNDLRASQYHWVKEKWRYCLEKAREQNRLDVPAAQNYLSLPAPQGGPPSPSIIKRLHELGFHTFLKPMPLED